MTLKYLNGTTRTEKRGMKPGTTFDHNQSDDFLAALMRLAFVRSRAQAKFRKEDWELTWEEYQNIWKDSWHLRQDTPPIVLTRIETDRSWCVNNVELTTQNRHIRKTK